MAIPLKNAYPLGMLRSQLGFYLLYLCLIMSLFGFLTSLAAAKWRSRKIWLSSKTSLFIVFGLCLSASLVLWSALFARDFSVSYAFKNSSRDLPWLYTLTAFWSSLEGSHLLWTLLMSACAALCVATYSKSNEHLMPFVAAALQLILAWMFYLAVSYSDPFMTLLPSPRDGQGMNTLLQNPYMGIHPPLLFIGYTTLVIPWAYSIAVLWYGDMTDGWLRTVRRWALVSFCFLSVAITLGGRWAYVELGWGGYWAWDPVENSSFLPWLIVTALLHTLLLQDRFGLMKKLSVLLSIFAFFMTFFGTFITRSGVITSVHSFGQGPIGPNYLLFLVALLVFSLFFFAFRSQALIPADPGKIWGVAKETAVAIGVFLNLVFAAIVWLGTIFPILTEAVTKQKISIQAPYFNTFAPYVGFAAVLVMGAGNLLHYVRSPKKSTLMFMGAALLISVPMVALFYYYGSLALTSQPKALFMQLLGSYLCFWSFCCLSFEVFLRWRIQAYKFSFLFKSQKAFLGAYIVHVGVLIAILGFLGNYRGLEEERQLTAGSSTDFQGYRLTFEKGIQTRLVDNATLYYAPILVSPLGRGLNDSLKEIHLEPGRSKYTTSQDMTHEVSFYSTFWHDLYLVLADFDRSTGEKITLKVYYNPTVRLVWLSAVLAFLGGMLALSDSLRGKRSRDQIYSTIEGRN